MDLLRQIRNGTKAIWLVSFYFLSTRVRYNKNILDFFLENYNMHKCKKLTNKINVNDLEYITLKNCQMWYCREYKNENQLETKYCIRTKFSNEFLKQYSIDE